MPYRITNTTTLNSIFSAYKANNWQLAYQKVFEALTDSSGNPKTGVDEASWIWVDGARRVNGNDGAFADYIRDYTARQYELRKGSLPTNIKAIIDTASNNIAKTFIADLLDVEPGPKLGSDAGIMPTLNEIGKLDAAGVASGVFTSATSTSNANYSPWAGTVLFTNLGDKSFYSNWILQLGTSSYKREAGAYDLISAAQITTELKTLGRALEVGLEELGIYYRINRIGETSTNEAMQLTQDFLKQAYGNDVGTINIAASIFSETTALTQSAKTYRVGTVFNDSGTKALTVERENVIVHAGAGNDTINVPAVAVNGGYAGLRIIDAGEGTDTISYAAIGTGLLVTFQNQGGFGSRAFISKGSATSTIDLAFGFETLTLSEKADIVTNLPGIAPKTSLKLNAGSGDDKVTLQKLYTNVTIDGGVGTGDSLSAANMTTPVTFDVGAGKVTSGTTLMTYSNFEKFEGTNYDDIFYATNKTTSINGRGGVDTVDFSKLTTTPSNISLQGIENIVGSKYADKFINLDSDLTNSSILGGNGNDSILGGGGNDTIRGQVGNDTLYGGAGNDYLFDDTGFNFLYGDAGNDTVSVKIGDAIVSDGTGDDLIAIVGDVNTSNVDDYRWYEINLGTGNDTVNIDFPDGATNDGYPPPGVEIKLSSHDGADKLIIEGIVIQGTIPRELADNAWYMPYQGHHLWVQSNPSHAALNGYDSSFSISFGDQAWSVDIINFQSGDFGIYLG